ncbi:hypothetical protein ACFWZT_03785 [Streptomyces alboflavus]|uniref:hypothetical protein n=1 Tax=Streptomyces TaxID=1883 RepID=UPI000F6589D3|nr:hypothetical protein [Streptomyces alboflavus]
MRKVCTAILTGLFSVTLFVALPGNQSEARAITFDPNACLDLSQVQVCKKGYIWKNVPMTGPVAPGKCRPWVSVKTKKKC